MELLGVGFAESSKSASIKGPRTADEDRKSIQPVKASASFQKLDKTGAFLIFKGLDLKDLCKVARVCKNWNQQVLQVDLWKEVATRYNISTQPLVSCSAITTREILSNFKESLTTTGYLLIEALGEQGNIFRTIGEGHVTALTVVPRKGGLTVFTGTNQGMLFAWGAKSLPQAPFYKRTLYETVAYEGKRRVDALFYYNWPNYGDRKGCIVTSAIVDREYHESSSFLEEFLNTQVDDGDCTIEFLHKYRICSFDSVQRGKAKIVALGTVRGIAIYKVEGNESKFAKSIFLGIPADFMKIIPYTDGKEDKYLVVANSKNKPNRIYYADLDRGKDMDYVDGESSITGLEAIQYNGKMHFISFCKNGMIQVWNPSNRSRVINFWISKEAKDRADSPYEAYYVLCPKTWTRLIAVNELAVPVLIAGNSDGEIVVFDPNASLGKRTLQTFEHTEVKGRSATQSKAITALCHVSAFNCQMIVSSSEDGTIRVWKLKETTPKATVKVEEKSFLSKLFGTR